MLRMMYRAQIKNQHVIDCDGLRADSIQLEKMIAEGLLMTISLFSHSNQLFLYGEYCQQEMFPDILLPSINTGLEEWPGNEQKRKWVPMIDIYHASLPQSISHWRRRSPVEERRGKLIRLKQNMLGSYIYYHFQLQEEHRETDNKYCLIGLHENYLFYYDETPFVEEVHSWQGVMNTNNSPDNWREVMEPHFIYWEGVDENDIRRLPMKSLLSL